MKKYTAEVIKRLPFTHIFVFGSNQFGIHGAGSALAAKNFGAQNSCPIGLVGQSYGIITKSFTNVLVTLDFISEQVKVLYSFALLRPDLTFHVTKIGTALAGFSIEDIAHVFISLGDPPLNIILPKEFQ